MKKPKTNRPDWSTYFLNIAILVSSRSTCIRRAVGAVFVRDRQILATGYNGVPKGIEHCESTGCLRDKLNIPSGTKHELCRGLHAEQNGIIQAATHGIDLSGSTLYCTTMPCIICTKMLINLGIKEIFYTEGYPDGFTKEMLSEAKIQHHLIEGHEL